MTRDFYDKEEIEQIKKLHSVYSAQMTSIGHYMMKEFYEPASKAGGIPPEFLEMEQKEYEEICRENDEINARIAKKKEDYFDKRMKMLEDEVIEEKLCREDLVNEASQDVDEFLKANLVKDDCCVTPENFDAILQKALDNPISYEYCIDRAGRKYSLTKKSQEPVTESSH